MEPLEVRLGHPEGTSVLLLTADGMGLSHASNVGTYKALREGSATTAGLSVPCPWARHAIGEYRGEAVGVHLTLNAEHDRYRWGPITHGPSLVDGDGGFPRTVSDLWEHADVDEVRREARAQVERAIWWGFHPTHLSIHLDALTLRPEFFDVVLGLAVEHRLPVRLPTGRLAASAGFDMHRLAAEEGLVFPDSVIRSRHLHMRDVLQKVLVAPLPGVTEVVLHPAADTPELRALVPDRAADLADDLDLAADPALAERVAAAGIVLASYHDLRALMRP